MVRLADVHAARGRIRDGIVQTPCKHSQSLQDLVSGRLYFKFENLQRTGSFKDRGALNKLLLLSDEEKRRGVVTASAGNHAQAVAFHASRLGIDSTVVMPEFTPLIKVANTRGYGAEVIQQGATLSDGLQEVERLVGERGLTLVHAFDDEAVIAGQGTIGLELVEQVPEVETVVVPIGGGGIISGIALAVKTLKPSVRIIGVEAEAAASAKASREAGGVVSIESAETLADGIAVKRVGERTFPMIQEYVDDIVTVGEEEIASAVLLLLEREKTVVEGAGAVPLAALMTGRIPLKDDEPVVGVLCGGNIDVNMISRIIERGLVGDGRMTHFIVKVRDRPGSLSRLTELAARMGANVLDVHHRRGFADISVGDVEIVLQLETRGRDHVAEIIQALEERGLQVEVDV
ncbi:threonine ammonia-lyase [Gemmatimonadota bacterium]